MMTALEKLKITFVVETYEMKQFLGSLLIKCFPSQLVS